MPKPDICISSIEPTVYIRKCLGVLQRLVHVHLHNSADEMAGTLSVGASTSKAEWPLERIVTGDSLHNVYVQDMDTPFWLSVILKVDGTIVDEKQIELTTVPHWNVHVVQNSHHDLGYTDLPSHVLKVHERALADAIDMAAATADYPDDAKFKIVIEQAWSLQHFLDVTSAAQSREMIRLLQQGQFELTAMYGNLITELCSHEELVRSLYPAFRLKRLHGIPINSAEHNDITGISWGVAQVLADAGVQIFVPGLPLYYNWGGLGLQSFWDEEAIFAWRGPGAFWWEAPSGKQILFWCNNSGCGGDCRPDMPGLVSALEKLPQQGYPLDVLRWPVIGGARDNSSYVPGYADTIRRWNEKWAYPHLVCSTNAKFYAALRQQVAAPEDVNATEKLVTLPRHRGELPGQDYPVGATSTAAATGVNRNTHGMLTAGEKLASISHLTTDAEYPRDTLWAAYEDVLLHDEHSWGHHFPAGPSARASEYEKAVHAYRGAALAHDVLNKAMARIADHVKVDGDYPTLVVFNLTDACRSDIVRAPLRELDNCGSTMFHTRADADTGDGGYLKGVLLYDRWHVNLPDAILAGHFRLVDAATSEELPQQINTLSESDALPYSAERTGLGSGTARYGIFESPIGIKRDLCFIARDVPAYGYKTYRLVPTESITANASQISVTDTSLENQFYAIKVNEHAVICSILDKELGYNLVDSTCPQTFFSLIVRDPYTSEWTMHPQQVTQVENGPVTVSLHLTGYVHGHPVIQQTISLHSGIKRVDMAVRILKDATPLLDAHLAFPFDVPDSEFQYEGSNATIRPIIDYLPGSQSDRIAVQDWVRIGNDDLSIVWSSLDAPIVSMGGLWPGYVSPAHRCYVGDEVKTHHRLEASDLKRGWLYSDIYYNNLGTNFAVSQNGDHLFRYAFTSHSGRMSAQQTSHFGKEVTTPLQQILGRMLPDASLAVTDQPVVIAGTDVLLQTLKQAEDGHGYIARLWNTSDALRVVSITMPQQILSAWRTNIVEEDLEPLMPTSTDTVEVQIGPRDLATVRIVLL